MGDGTDGWKDTSVSSVILHIGIYFMTMKVNTYVFSSSMITILDYYTVKIYNIESVLLITLKLLTLAIIKLKYSIVSSFNNW